MGEVIGLVGLLMLLAHGCSFLYTTRLRVVDGSKSSPNSLRALSHASALARGNVVWAVLPSYGKG
jgi:hypothetical protein